MVPESTPGGSVPAGRAICFEPRVVGYRLATAGC